MHKQNTEIPKNAILMANNDWKARLGMVYSTNPDFEYKTDEVEEAETLDPAKQDLRVWLDR